MSSSSSWPEDSWQPPLSEEEPSTSRSRSYGSSRATGRGSRFALTNPSVWDEGGFGNYWVNSETVSSASDPMANLPSRIRGQNRKRNHLKEMYDERIHDLEEPSFYTGNTPPSIDQERIDYLRGVQTGRIAKVDRRLKRLTDRALGPGRKERRDARLADAIKTHLYDPDKNDFMFRHAPVASNSVLASVAESSSKDGKGRARARRSGSSDGVTSPVTIDPALLVPRIRRMRSHGSEPRSVSGSANSSAGSTISTAASRRFAASLEEAANRRT